MGAAGSRAAAAGRSYQAADAASRAAAAVPPGAGGAVAVDSQRAAAQAQAGRRVLSLEEEEALEARDAAMAPLLDQLGGAIRDRHINIMPQQSDLRPTASQTSSAGRLPSHALAELLELQRQAAGAPPDISELVAKYQVQPQLVQRVLATVCLPELMQAQGPGGVAAIADYPDWFRRRN